MKFKLPKLASLRSPSIGHLILNTMRYLDICNNNEKIIITTVKKKIVNYEIYKILKNHYQSKNVIFIHSQILFIIYKILFKLKNKFTFLKKHIANIEWYHHEIDFEKNYGAEHRFYDDKSFKIKSKISTLSDQEYKFNLWKENSKINKKFVVLFSRDGGFYKDKENPRNCDFNNYKKTIDYLIKKDFAVIRMGRFYEKNFNYDNINFFDYSRMCNQNYDDLIELMIFKRCEFMIGSVTGMLSYNTLFDKPLLINNWFPAGYYPWFKNSTYIPKIYMKNGEYLKFNEIPKNILLSEDEEILSKNSLRVIENSEEEIFRQVYNYLNFNLNFSMDLSGKDYYVCGSGSKIDKDFYNKYEKLF